jgi:hypothetical protein
MCTNSICRSSTTPENGDSSAPARCRRGSPGAVRVRPRSHPGPASLSDRQNLYPLPRPSTPAYTHPPRSTPGSLARTPTHRAESPVPTPGLPLSGATVAVPQARRVSTSSAGSSVPPSDTRDAFRIWVHDVDFPYRSNRALY